MRRSPATLVLLLAIAALTPVTARVHAQGSDPAAAKPGRNPSQPLDEAYTKKIKEYTTETFFLSPLVDYMPAKAGVPTPTAVLGDIAGAPGKLPYSKEVYDYMRRLEKALPARVKVYSIGKTEEGREHIAVAIGSEELMRNYDANRAKLAKLADPRTIGMDDKLAAALVTTTAPVYYITGTIHSSEAGAPTALMELAYRLAVDDAPYVKNIRDHVITLITPIVEVDGRDRVVDLYEWKKKHPNDVAPNLLYWGKYVAHDNNRDAMGVTLKLTENVLNAYVDHKALILHDLHESVAYLYDNTIGDGPYNSWLDPLVTNEWQLIGWNNVQEMTRYGMPGVFAHGNFDTWSPGYLMFIAATHNGISRLYETFGNGGSAETVERILGPNDTQRSWFKQNPPLPRVMWSLRNNNNYEQTGLLVSLSYVAANRYQLLQNFYEKSKRSILKAKTEGPAAYILTANETRPGAQAELLRVLQKQRVEISRATAPFSVTVPVKVVAQGGAGRGGRGAGRGGAGNAGPQQAGDTAVTQQSATSSPPPARTESKDFPVGSYIIRMDQPYSRIADALLDYQYWSPNDPQKNPYDDTGWTFPEGFAVQAVRVIDPKVLTVAMEPVKGEIRAQGGVTGNGSTFLINANGDNGLATLRYKLKSADIQAAEEPFESGGAQYKRGSFVIKGVSQADLDAAAKELGLKAAAVASAPSVKMHPVRAARVAIMHTWQSTQTEGWWRMAFDKNDIPFTYISTQDVAKDANLNAKYDVIVFGPGGGAGRGIIDGMPMWRNPIPWKVTPETPNITPFAQTDDMRPGLGYEGLQNLLKFVKNGGVYIGSVGSAQFAIDYGMSNGVSMNTAARGTVTGSFLKTRIVDDASPIVYGVADGIAAYTDGGESFNVSATAGGGRGGGGGGGGRGGAPARETGRGQPDDVDEVQGRPALEDRFKAPVRPTVQPWQYAPITDEQLRSPLGIIPPDQRPRVALRYGAQNELLVSGLLSGGGDIAQRAAVVDSPMEKGHVVLFSINPLYRGETIGTYPLVFNTILNFDNLNAGRKLDPK
jgi:hypothetical protein